MQWSDTETARLLERCAQGHDPLAIASELGRSEMAVRGKLLSLGFSSRRPTAAPASPASSPCAAPGSDFVSRLPSTDFLQVAEEGDLDLRARVSLESREARIADRRQLRDAETQILEDRILEEFRRSLCEIQSLPPATPLPPPPSRGDAVAAVLVVSDCHVGQVVDPREVDYLGAYDPAQFLARLRLLETRVANVLRGRPVDRLLVLFGGDIVEGNLGHALEHQTVPIAEQVDLAVHSLYLFLKGLGSLVPSIEIHGVVGNHGRWPVQKKTPSTRRWSNLDSLVYQALAAVFEHAGPSSFRFDPRISSRRQIDVSGFRIQLQHGDEVRGGNSCVTGMTREVFHSTLRCVQAGNKAPDLYVVGDKHFAAAVPFGSGAFLVNPSFVGVDPYAMNFIPSPPAQTLFFVHPTLGRTETHRIRLDGADLALGDAYNLKPNLRRLVDHYKERHHEPPDER